ncbi:ribosomal protein L11, amine-terminal domain protein (macronuclear) [Tetrahymena thermophila SB210]|uniref:Ribosomal protein L11, amine-terminal domain protein n=1 Tax=Tetrahymena thermophila (strain SB210) TaxID=312017 RepID=Q22N00_TETTS|nr:ribosomal protein L11, amine-terminal domain protein [Tetrahymena thermophila SB210]EAR86256.2 ribosomal protein L11, amine-terminal domain protein [Tetrahymena thermophila SB210]|eukprot:XP_976870.2 ribosomal protein L11, amine-terminal domain protein [Tetrahymena thermophila SB210]
MPPKVDPNEVRFINIKVFGGEPGPASTLAPKLGPLGLNAKKVGEDIIAACNQHKGIRVMIQLKCQNRAAQVTVVNTSSALIIKELGKHVRDRKKTKGIKHSGDLSLEQIKKIAKIMQDENKSFAKTFAGTVKSVLGTAQSIGITVNKLHPKKVIEQINKEEIKI